MRLVWRYLLLEILGPFVGGLIVITFGLVMFQILRLVDMVIVQGVSVSDVARLLAFLLLPFLGYTLPIAFLLGVILAIGRMSSDSEIVALRASGTSLYQLLPPVLALALVVGSLGAYLSHSIEPMGKRKLRELLWELAQSKITVGVKEGTFNDAFKDVLIYANKTNPRKNELEGILIYQGVSESQVVFAKAGRFERAADGLPVLVLVNGSIHPASARGSEYNKVRFDSYRIRLELEKVKKIRMFPWFFELPTRELARRIKSDRDRLKVEEFRRMRSEFHRRFSFPVASVLFAFIGLALGLAPPRSGRARGVTVSLLVVAVYYILFRTAENMSWRALIDPALAMWIPNMVVGGFGIAYFIHQARK